MLLNGWKEIATYLHSGTRTVQRWEALGLPVTRVRLGKRGPVVARTENLDAWLNRPSLKNKARIRPDMQATFDRVASTRARMMEELRLLLQNELRIGMALAERALRKNGTKTAERCTIMALQAYDVVQRLAVRLRLSEVSSPQFEKDVNALKASLRKLGKRT